MRLLILAVLSGLALSGCGCTQIGCNSGVSFKARESLELGSSVKVTIIMPGETVTCSGTETSLDCDVIRIQQFETTVIYLERHEPYSAHVIVESDGQVVMDESADRILYHTQYPNGDSCPGECRNSAVQF
ncbi:MAG: hypothetical protein R3B07_07065 [Polyangiaceae bacterium]